MTRVAWRPVERSGFDPRAEERALAYCAPDGAFALYNDYREGAAFLVPGADPAEPDGLAAIWQRPRGAARPFPTTPLEPVDGYGVFTFPYGPISMGVPESGRFDLRTYGERILSLTPYAGYKSRRIVPSIAGLSVPDAGLRIERFAGNFSAAHVAAFLAAAESAQGIEVPRIELWTRALAQELQRIYNHLHVIARVAEAASQNIGLAQTHALAEEVLRLQGAVFGHRWLFGALLPGGPTRRLDLSHRRELAAILPRQAAEFDSLWALFVESRTFIDRIQSTCAVSRESAIRWGAVGPTVRACGVAWDDRLRVPAPPYTDLFLALPHETAGDALARILVRAHEIRASFLLLEQMLDRWPSDGGATEPAERPVAPGRGLGRVESPSGDLVYDVAVADGRVRSVDLRTPSQANWPLLAEGLRGGVFTDFHFAWESFGLVFADTDG
jgi:Ni,Fe-hydrogenase III large subunit